MKLDDKPGILYLDEKGLITFCNEHAMALLGHSKPATLQQKPFAELFDISNTFQDTDAFQHILASYGRQQFLLKHDGVAVDLDIRLGTQNKAESDPHAIVSFRPAAAKIEYIQLLRIIPQAAILLKDKSLSLAASNDKMLQLRAQWPANALDQLIATPQFRLRVAQASAATESISEKTYIWQASSHQYQPYSLNIANTEIAGETLILITFEEIAAWEAIEQQKEQLALEKRLLEEACQAGTWRLDLKEQTLVWSHGAFQLLGIPQRNKYPSVKHLMDQIHPDDCQPLIAQIEQAIRKNGKAAFRFRLMGPGQKILQIVGEGRFEYDFSQRKSFVLGTVQDVSGIQNLKQQLLQVQKKLKLLEEKNARQVASPAGWQELLADWPGAVVLVNQDLEVNSWNKEAQLLLGWQHSEALGKKITGIMPRDFLEKDFKPILTALRQQNHWRGYLAMVHKSRKVVQVEAAWQSRATQDNTPGGWLVFLQNVEKVKQEPPKPHITPYTVPVEVFEGLPGWILWVGKDLRCLGCNKRFAEQLGIPETSGIKGLAIEDLPILTDFSSVLKDSVTQVLTTSQAYRHPDKAVIGKAGKKFWVEIFGVPYGQSHKASEGVLLMMNDISQRKQIELELKEKEANLEAIIENTHDYVCYMDKTFKVKALNSAFKRIHKAFFDFEAIPGESYLPQLPPSFRSQLEEIFTFALKGHKLVTEREIKLENKKVWLEITCSPVLNNLEITGLCYIARDITKRKQSERILLDSKVQREKIRSRALIQGQEEERKRISMELHDGVGQILTALQMQVSYLKDKLQAVIPNELHDGFAKMSELVNYSKQEVRRISFNLMPSILYDFGIGEAIKYLGQTIHHNSNIHVTCQVGTGEHRFDAEVEMGLFRIAQEILNNAMKHSQATEIGIKLSCQQGHIFLKISDNGVGMESSEMEYYKTRGKGIKHIFQRVNLLEGKMEVKTKQAQGCTYLISIPQEKQEEQEGLTLDFPKDPGQD